VREPRFRFVRLGKGWECSGFTQFVRLGKGWECSGLFTQTPLTCEPATAGATAEL